VDSTALTATLSVASGTLNVATGGGAAIGGNGSGSVTISGSAAQINSALAALSYRGNLDFAGADTLTITTSDGALNDIDTVPITVNAVNDPPVNTVPAPQSVAEDTTLPIPGLSVADVDGTVLTTTLTVASGTLTIPLRGGGLITGNGTNSLVINGTATQINNALATLHYHGNLDFNGSDTLTVTTSDGSLSDTDTVPITVNAVNDAPVNTVPGPQTVAEDTTLPIAGVSVADVDSTALTTTLSVTNGTLNVTTGGGAVIAGGGTATVTISGTATQINNALTGLSYLGNLDFHGSDTLTVATSDGSVSDIDVVGIAVGEAGDPPVNTVPGPQTVDEDTVLPIAGVLVADVDSTVLTTTLSVANGTLDVTGTGCQRQRNRNCYDHGVVGADQRRARHARLSRQSRFQRLGHVDRLDVRRSAHRHRHGRDHGQPGERSAGQHRAGRAERQRGHHPVDHGRVGGGRRQHGAHRHAHRRARHAERDGHRRQRQRQRDAHDRGHGRGDQCRARHAQLSRRSQFPRRRHADRRHLGRFPERHRHGADHRPGGERCAGQHGASRADRR
jgi:VCBS repeat-containing protein